MSSLRRDAAARFCLVTPAHVCNNPRLVKEADALHAAGHAVRVVSLRTRGADAARDRVLMSTRGWRLDTVDVTRESAPVRWLVNGVAQRGAQHAFVLGFRRGLVRDLAASRFVVPLALAAAGERADVYVAHNVEALPAAAWAARRHGARLAFDVEDLHEGILPDGETYAAERERIVAVQRRYLPSCDRLTAAAPGIADEITRRYDVARPLTILNAFPGSDRPAEPIVRRDRVSDAPALYWFSQTLGADRGIEDAIGALARLEIPAHLYLRGAIDDGYRAALISRVAELGLADRVHLLDVVPPGEIVARAAEHDIGLALEQPTTLNRDLCVTNKLFVYMLAGIAVVATDTRGQRDVLESAETGALLYPPGDAAALASRLGELLASPPALARARAAALSAALGPLAWEREAARLVAYLEGVPTESAPAESLVVESLA